MWNLFNFFFFYLNIIANDIGSVEKYLANKSVQADIMDGILAYEHKL